MYKLILAAMLAVSTAAAAIPPLPGPPPPQPPAAPAPKLIVVIAVDQFSANLFDEYRPQFTAGLARLSSGIVFHNGYQSHAATETCPGHSTILTGDHPAHTGIIANVWIDQAAARPDKNVYCAEDETAPGTSSAKYKVSPKHLMVPTLGDLMKARWPASRNVAVSGKDRAAVMMGGHHPDQRWYWTGAKFDTDLEGVSAPQSIGKVNALVVQGLGQARPALEPTPFCLSKERLVMVEGGGKPVGTGRFARAAGDQAAFRASPELDGDTLALAAALVDEMKLGRGPSPDVLAVSLSATDYVGHSYGTEGEEMCLQLTELDREIGDFLKVLDGRGIDYSVTLTADHGGKDIPERERLAGVPSAARVNASLGAAAMGRKLAAELGLQGPGLLGESSFGDIYLDHSLSSADQARLLAAAVAAYRASPQVEAVFTGAELAATSMPTGSPDRWSLIQRARASYYAGRSGDFVVLLKKDITPIADTTRYIATHGSPWDYDRRVPILFWRPGLTGTTVERAADTVDIMPTLAATVGLDLAPASVDGRCLDEAAVCRSPIAAAPERGHR